MYNQASRLQTAKDNTKTHKSKLQTAKDNINNKNSQRPADQNDFIVTDYNWRLFEIGYSNSRLKMGLFYV